MNNKIKNIWNGGIQWSDEWLKCSTSRLDRISPSWARKRENLLSIPNDFSNFMDKLKREHAIETGIVEKLYDLNRGVTETFIQAGFNESFLSHGDTNIAVPQLMSFLQDHSNAVDFIFDFIKSERELSKGFIKELHQLTCSNQKTVDALDSKGNTVKIPLLKGEFKKQPNNPKRLDSIEFLYCPPEQVESEMDRLIDLYNQHSGEKPIIVAAWFHHAFSQIHPFQDGNGRLARLLATLILLKANLLPFTVKREKRDIYISALEKADEGHYQELISFFCEQQALYIELAISESPSGKSLDEVISFLGEKVNKVFTNNEAKHIQEKQFICRFEAIRDLCEGFINSFKNKINELHNNFEISVDGSFGTSNWSNHHSFIISINLPEPFRDFVSVKGYDIVLKIVRYRDQLFISWHFSNQDDNQIHDKKFTLSLDAQITDEVKKDIENYLEEALTLGLAQVASEIG